MATTRISKTIRNSKHPKLRTFPTFLFDTKIRYRNFVVIISQYTGKLHFLTVTKYFYDLYGQNM